MTTTFPVETPAPVVVEDWDQDPLAGIPAEVIERIGACDVDTAGGCG